MKQSENVKQSTVVAFERDARFFVERGLRSLDRYDYEKAQRCFRRAIELEPDNAHYHCHLASVLAEMGQLEASNDILHRVLDEIDPGMVDVYFYLANNYANLQDFHTAEEMALRYLQESGRGVYAEEAEELLDYIYVELDLPPRRLLDASPDDVYVKHEQARRSLEEGRFLEAMEGLKEIVQTHPTFIPAWNNLALAYYYIGDFAKAMETIERTLEREPGNLHALCNLAVLLSHHNRVAELLELISALKKIVPYHPDQAYKLATTMGVLGQHEEAYRLYRQLLRSGACQDPTTYHYAAISAYLTDRIDQAVRWWQKVKQLDPESGVADYYLQGVKEQGLQLRREEIPYHYQVPYRDAGVDAVKWATPEALRSDPLIRASLLWALQHGNPETQHMVIQTLAMIGDEEAETTLRYFCQYTNNPSLKKLALLALSEMGAQLPDELLLGNHPSSRKRENRSGRDLVVPCIDRYMAEEADLQRWARKAWQAYTAAASQPLPVRKAEAWAAALEYLYGKKMGQKRTQASLAEKYRVSTATLAKCVKELLKIDL